MNFLIPDDMPDKKLTDNEIVKEIEELLHTLDDGYSTAIEYGGKRDEQIEKELGVLADAVEFINRQKAEIERLKPFENKIAGFNSHIRVEDMLVFASSIEEWLEFCENLKAEAYKECVEKVKEKSNKSELVCSSALVRTDYTITKDDLDNLLKKLVGEQNG